MNQKLQKKKQKQKQTQNLNNTEQPMSQAYEYIMKKTQSFHSRVYWGSQILGAAPNKVNTGIILRKASGPRVLFFSEDEFHQLQWKS